MARRLAVTTLLKVVGLLVVTRLIGPEQYGPYVIAFGLYSYAVLLGEAGIVTALVRRSDEPSEAAWASAATLLGLAALILGLVLVGLSAMVARIAGAPDVAWLLPLMLAALPLQLLTGPALGRLERRLDYRLVARVELARDLVYYALSLALAVAGFGAAALAVALIAQHALGLLLAYRLADARPRFGFEAVEARAMLRFAAGFSGANLIWQARALVLPLIAAPLIGPAATGIAGLTVAIAQVLSGAMNIVWRMSVASLGRLQSDAAALAAGVAVAMRLSVLAAGVPLLLFGWIAGAAVGPLFGERWSAVASLFPFVAAAYLTAALFRAHSAALTALACHHELGRFHLLHLAVLAGATAVLVRAFGVIGFGLAELAAIPTFALLHWQLGRSVGAPATGVALAWWAAALVGLFWREIGVFAVVVPFAALALPGSRRQLRELLRLRRAVAHA